MPVEMLKTYFAKKIAKPIKITLGTYHGKARTYAVEIVGLDGDRAHGSVSMPQFDRHSKRRTGSTHVDDGDILIQEWMTRDDVVAAIAVNADHRHYDRYRNSIENGYTLDILKAVDADLANEPDKETDTPLEVDHGLRGDPYASGKIPAFPLSPVPDERKAVLDALDVGFVDRSGRDMLPGLLETRPSDPDVWFERARREREPEARLRLLDATMRLAWSRIGEWAFESEPCLYALTGGGSAFACAIDLYAVTLIELDRPADAFHAAREMYRFDAYRCSSLLTMAAAAATTRDPGMIEFTLTAFGENKISSAPWLWALAALEKAAGKDPAAAEKRLLEARAANPHFARLVGGKAVSPIDTVAYGPGTVHEAIYMLPILQKTWQSIGGLEADKNASHSRRGASRRTVASREQAA